MQPWEVRFAHPYRARARHPIHKAMGGHASHGHTSDRVFITFQFHKGALEHLRVDTLSVLMRNPQISHMLNFPLHIEASYSLLIRSTNSSGVSISIFEKPNHFLPKSLMDAPM